MMKLGEVAQQLIVKNDSYVSKLCNLEDQLCILEFAQFLAEIDRPDAQEEKLLRFSLPIVLDSYSFFVKRFLYHMKNYFANIKIVLSYLKERHSSDREGGNVSILVPHGLLNAVSFEFESLIGAFAKLIEEPIKEDIGKIFKGCIRKDFLKIFPKNLGDDDLRLRLNFLRNRVIHVTSPRYENNEEGAFRYRDFSSKIYTVFFINGILKMPCTLFDLYLNPAAMALVKSELAKGNKHNLFELLFSENKPKGRHKNSPGMLYGGYCHYDYLNHFDDLFGKFIDLINKINYLFSCQILMNCDSDEQREKIKHNKLVCTNDFIAEREISFKDVFGLESIR